MNLTQLAQMVGEKLSTSGSTLSTAESCTGGLLGSVITDVPGSSSYYLGGVVSYSNELKIRLLGVRAQTLESVGAVSPETVQEMAAGIRAVSGSDFALAISGIAGPGGGSALKPVGLVFIGFAGPCGVVSIQKQFAGSRPKIKEQTVQAALELLLSS